MDLYIEMLVGNFLEIAVIDLDVFEQHFSGLNNTLDSGQACEDSRIEILVIDADTNS